MKLHEEFKLIENMWDEDVALEEAAPTTPKYDPFTWTVDTKTYDISNNAELRAYIEAAAQDRLVTNAADYASLPTDDKQWSAIYDVFKELIAFYDAQPNKDYAFINRLHVLKDRILGDMHKYADQLELQQEISDLADACVTRFLNQMKKLTKFYKYNIDEPYCQNLIDTTKEELVKLGMDLAQPNYIEN